jgi:hypothetical protein
MEQDAKTPPVYGQPIALAVYHLGSQVLGGAAQREGLLRHHLGVPEIHETNMAVTAEADILRLYIALHD